MPSLHKYFLTDETVYKILRSFLLHLKNPLHYLGALRACCMGRPHTLKNKDKACCFLYLNNNNKGVIVLQAWGSLWLKSPQFCPLGAERHQQEGARVSGFPCQHCWVLAWQVTNSFSSFFLLPSQPPTRLNSCSWVFSGLWGEQSICVLGRSKVVFERVILAFITSK